MNVISTGNSSPPMIITEKTEEAAANASRLSERRQAHLIAYGCFLAGAVVAFARAGSFSSAPEFLLIAAIAWFPVLVVESFRRLGIERYGFAAAPLCLIAGFDGLYRLFHPWHGGGC